MTPAESIAAIDKFLDSVSWADLCTRLESSTGHQRLLAAPEVVYVPCHWTEWREHEVEVIKLRREHETKYAGLIFVGECEKQTVQTISMELHRRVLFVDWQDIPARVAYYEMVSTLLGPKAIQHAIDAFSGDDVPAQTKPNNPPSWLNWKTDRSE